MKIEFRYRRALPLLFRVALCLFASSCLSPLLLAQNTPVLIGQTITTIAGNGINAATGDGGPAINASLSNEMRAVAADATGNLWIVDGGNSKIRYVNAQSGIITTVAGGASTVCASPKGIDKAGDGCIAATQTILNKPRGIFLDKTGALYIAGYSDSSIHRIDPVTGIMTLVAGYVAYTGSGTCTTPSSCFSGQKGYSGDNGQAVGAALNSPRGVAVDNNGNVWIVDTGNNVVRKVNAQTGVITTVVGYNPGTGSAASAGYAGDGMQANSSGVELNVPTDIVFDSSNNAYIVDFSNHRIRRVDAVTNVITTVIGNGATNPTTGPYSFTPAYQQAANVNLGGVTKIAIDNQNNLYITDSSFNVVYFYDAATGYVHVIAGNYGYGATGAQTFTVCAAATDTLGDGCNALQANFSGGSSAIGVTIDAANNLYITDPNDERVRKVSTNVVFPASATGTSVTQPIELHYTANDGPTGTGIAVPAGTTDYSVSTSPTCVTNADNTQDCSFAVTFDPTLPGVRNGNLLSTGTLTHAGYGLQGIGNASLLGLETGTTSLLGTGLASPGGTVLDALGNLYMADTANNRVIKINGSTLAQTTITGTGTAGYTGDGGAALSATLKSPATVAIDASGNLLIADTGNNVIRHVDLVSGIITTIAGAATSVCATARDTVGDGCPALSATLKAPSGLVVDNIGNIYIADTGNGLIRRLDPRFGYLNLYGGGATTTCATNSDTYGDACPANQASFLSPSGLALDAANNLYIADSGNNLIREISAANFYVSAVAGNGQTTYTGDGGAATSAALNTPAAIALDAANDIYIADTGNHVIRVVNGSSKIINTLFGTGGISGNAGGYGQASQISLNAPGSIAVSSTGGIYIADTGNSRAILVNTAIADLAFGNSNLGVTTPSQTLSVNNIGNLAMTFSQSPAYSVSGAASSYIISTSASTTCPGAGALAVAGLCTYSISFDPSTKGTLNASLTLPGNAVNAATANAQLTGKGVQLANTNVAIALTSPASSSLSYGQVGTITATVSPASGTGTPTGNVIFSIDSKLQPSATLVNAQTNLSVNLPVGQHTICATYSGDNTYAASNNCTTITVITAGTTSQLIVSPSAIIQLNTLTFSATISSTTTGIPTGTVNFMSGTTKLGAVTLNAKGVAVYTNSTLAVGTYQVTAVYLGDPNFAGSTSNAVTAVVNPIPPDFSASITPATLSVVDGASIQSTILVVPQGGITGTLTLVCAGQPANSQCRFFPTTLTLNGSNTAQATVLTFWTDLSVNGQVANQQPKIFDRRTAVAAGISFAVALIALLLRRRHKSLFASIATMLVMAALSLGTIGALSGCSNSTVGPAGVTPPGTYSMQLILSGPNGTVHAVPFTVTVVQQSENDMHAAPLAHPSLAYTASLLP